MSAPTADSCRVYNYYTGVSNPSSCATPSQGTTNNGNVIGYYDQDSVNAFSHTATYTYDNVNRLTNAVATGSATYNLTFSYTQDGSNGQYGNMSCVTNGQTNGLCANLSFNPANNQITTSGYTYDAAGNLTKDPSNLTAHTYQWDAEGRVSAVDPGASPTWSFTYNALGHRVQWAYGSSGGTYQHYFDPEGGWLGVWGSYDIVRFGDRYLLAYFGNNTVFNHVNNIGSTRMLTNPAGAAAEDMLFYPWGDLWQSWGGGGYNFAELPIRDLTTNTDLTMARVSGPNFGRWFSPDPAGKEAARLDDPQTWNMYAYVRNSPTTLTDPSGLWPWYIHEEIYEAAFSGLLTSNQIKIVEDRSFHDDFGPGAQSPENAYKHGMRSPRQSPQAAAAMTEAFIMNNLQAARALSGSGADVTQAALTALADAEHALTDEGSPEHRDASGTPQVWTGSWWDYPAHIYGESDPSASWYGFGQSIRNALLGLSVAAPEILSPSRVDAEATARITTAVSRYFMATHYSPLEAGEATIEEDAARQCALGNRAACN